MGGSQLKRPRMRDAHLPSQVTSTRMSLPCADFRWSFLELSLSVILLVSFRQLTMQYCLTMSQFDLGRSRHLCTDRTCPRIVLLRVCSADCRYPAHTVRAAPQPHPCPAEAPSLGLSADRRLGPTASSASPASFLTYPHMPASQRAGIFSWQRNPSLGYSDSTMPPSSYGINSRSRLVPKPDRVGGTTCGPPLSCH
jgi:hypothetical protein